MPKSLKSKIVLITGASSGFGADAARLFAREGSIVILTARRLDWLETPEPGADIDSQIDTNLRGLIQVTRAVLPSMLARRSGTIINMSSVAGLIPAPMFSVYAATKYGIRGFTDALRREVASFGVHVCGIYPCPAVTEFSQHSGSDSTVKRYLKALDWIYMSSAHVARRVVQLAKHPRRTMVIPWWFIPLTGMDAFLSGLVDWFLQVTFVKRFHRL